MITTLGFLDVSMFTAMYMARYKSKALLSTPYGGLMPLRDEDGDGKIVVMEVMKEWTSARSLFTKLRTAAAPYLDGQLATLMKAVVESLDPDCTTPWQKDEGEYARSIAQLRICMVPSPDAFSYSGAAVSNLLVGQINMVDHRIPHCETNFGPCTRVHLVVDVLRADAH